MISKQEDICVTILHVRLALLSESESFVTLDPEDESVLASVSALSSLNQSTDTLFAAEKLNVITLDVMIPAQLSSRKKKFEFINGKEKVDV